MENSLPRGLRNNNPLNLRRSNNAWLGKVTNPTDPAFEQFINIKFGLRAAFINIRTIIRRNNNQCTLRRLISTWAPSSDGNDTEAYVRRVALGAHLSALSYLDFKNQLQMVDIVYMMAFVECGQPISREIISQAYEMV